MSASLLPLESIVTSPVKTTAAGAPLLLVVAVVGGGRVAAGLVLEENRVVVAGRRMSPADLLLREDRGRPSRSWMQRWRTTLGVAVKTMRRARRLLMAPVIPVLPLPTLDMLQMTILTWWSERLVKCTLKALEESTFTLKDWTTRKISSLSRATESSRNWWR